MAKQKLKSLGAASAKVESIKSRYPAAVPTRNKEKGPGAQLMLMVPAETRSALRVRAGEQGTTVRALVLDALKRAGYPVSADEIADRRIPA